MQACRQLCARKGLPFDISPLGTAMRELNGGYAAESTRSINGGMRDNLRALLPMVFPRR